MAKWFRSEPMEYISLIMNEDAAHNCLGDLGKLGVIQFTDVRFVGTDSAAIRLLCAIGHRVCVCAFRQFMFLTSFIVFCFINS